MLCVFDLQRLKLSEWWFELWDSTSEDDSKPNCECFSNLFAFRCDKFLSPSSKPFTDSVSSICTRATSNICRECRWNFNKFIHALSSRFTVFFYHSYLRSTSDLIRIFTSHTRVVEHAYRFCSELNLCMHRESDGSGEKFDYENIVYKQIKKLSRAEGKI